MSVTSSRRHSSQILSTTFGYSIVAMVTSMSSYVCHVPPIFSMTLQTKMFSTETYHLFKQIIFSSHLNPCLTFTALSVKEAASFNVFVIDHVAL